MQFGDIAGMYLIGDKLGLFKPKLSCQYLNRRVLPGAGIYCGQTDFRVICDYIRFDLYIV